MIQHSIYLAIWDGDVTSTLLHAEQVFEAGHQPGLYTTCPITDWHPDTAC